MLIGNERGAVLVMGLLILLVLTILSLGAMMTTGTELRIASNDRSAKEAFYIAEAGVEEARSRLQVTSSSPIPDGQPANANWTAFIGTLQECQTNGFQGNGNQVRYDRLNPPNLDYVVTIGHKVNASNQILRWGDSNNDGKPEENTTTGNNIFVITSQGYTSGGATKSVRTECAQMPPITTPAALYTKEDTTVQGTSTHVIGVDGCGSSSVPGIITQGTLSQNGNPSITGSPSDYVQNSPVDIDVQYLVNQFKSKANYSYNQSSGTLTGMNWGSPTPGATQQSPSTCSSYNIVYINTNSTFVRLSGGTSGCGILLVDGILNIEGGFHWNGVVLVTGSISFTGGGGDGKNVTGAVLSGGMVSADLVGGNANIVYCSQGINMQTNNLPLVTLRWTEVFN